MGHSPVAVTADAEVRLLYELRLTNFSAKRVDLISLQVFSPDQQALADYHDAELEKRLASVGPPEDSGELRSIGAGRSVTLFLDITLGIVELRRVSFATH